MGSHGKVTPLWASDNPLNPLRLLPMNSPPPPVSSSLVEAGGLAHQQAGHIVRYC